MRVRHPEKKAVLFVVCYILINYAGIILLQDHSRLLTMTSDTLNILAPSLTAICLLRHFYRVSDKLKYFWLLSSLASFSFSLATIVDSHFIGDASGLSNIMWLTSLLLSLTAIIYANSLNKNSSRIFQFIFDIMIVMIVASAISWDFIIQPILNSSSDLGIFMTSLYLCYPIGTLALLFAILGLYYSSRSIFSKEIIVLAVIGFTVLFFANMIYLYLILHGSYRTGSWYDPLWSLALLIVGLAPFYDKANKRTYIQEEDQIDLKGKFRNFLSLRLMLPYISVMVIFCFMILQSSFHVNGLVIGSILSTFLIIVRQIFTLFQNNQLLQQSRELNKQLEVKVAQRTEELHHKNLELEYIAYHDSLTSLTNRRYFEEYVTKAIEKARPLNQQLAVLFIDLDRFKFINDTLGHSIGDLLLQKVARILQDNVGDRNMVSRQGGDEFMILLHHTSKEETERIARNIVSDLENRIDLNGNEVLITSSVGISMYPHNGDTVDTLIKRADISMYAAKEQGKNRYQFFDASMDEHIATKVNLEYGLRRAIEQYELQIHYQPMFNLECNEVTGVEALLRWNHSEYGLVPPSKFIPLAEETGLIMKIGDWVLREACLQLKRWNEQGLTSLKLSVNVSTLQFLQKGFVERVNAILKETWIDPQYLELEITESTMMDANEVIPILRKLKKSGIQISVDDFGSGYSSLSHLTKLPIDVLKIDRMFVEAIGNEKRDMAILSTIIALAHSLNLKVVAEGVETELQFKALKERGCNIIQGYYISKPLPVDIFNEEMIEKCKLRPDWV
ncbi:DUF4084 domain-containing protein [Cohnella pontilimi]|uniref:DUF4084 domain-containing protein n=1 Tax=Cohnella pontilimi TaxID=2564100 RepID=A0A4U0F5B8_9BACL|nr:DUF4084 domain-containing protein [Cohnella pontilimi]TJY39590.1 DUF4084 domain-containing protein [Cohnella pontilimi]